MIPASANARDLAEQPRGFQQFRFYCAREMDDRIPFPMHKAGDLLGGAVRRLKRPEATIAWLSSTWPTIVGKMLAAHTRPVRCENGLLEIATDGKDWKSQLEPMSAEFRGRINQAWGTRLVTEVKFLATRRSAAKSSGEGARGYATSAFEDEHLPFIRRRK